MPNTQYPIPNTQFLIIGYGKFGRLALDRLQQKFPSATFTVVDKQAETLSQIRDTSVRLLEMDGLAGLTIELPAMSPDDWIIPAIPIHVAYGWLGKSLRNACHLKALDIPDEIFEKLPNSCRGAKKAVYTSIADFICPDDCPEPEALCTYTGQPRPVVLNEALAKLKHPEFRSIVIPSSQLAPGVGGYRVSELETVLTEVTENPGPFLLATACKCHGVIHAFNVTPMNRRKDLTS
ncbi:hypothetical protein D3OALGB2SA_4433 [Olavius algarvensis associated proteobacterium Delta 3]|nr:hypothetical protein D3OALGB2SA_4433 [Olavius algarvensis associated proteobacterium Delta 3]